MTMPPPEPSDTREQLDALYPFRTLREDPPFEILDALKQSLSDLDPIGPTYDRVDLLSRFERNAFDGPRRRTVVENQMVTWFDGPRELKLAVVRSLPCLGHSVFDVRQHLASIEKRAHDDVTVATRSTLLSEQDLVQQGCVLLRTTHRIQYLDPRGTTYTYAYVGPDWARFFLALKKIELQFLDDIHLKVLAEGRALAVKSLPSGPELVPPRAWQHLQRFSKKGPSHHFVLTRDLPETWFYARLGPRSKEQYQHKKRALKWLNDIYREVDAQGLRATKPDVFAQLSLRFGISETGMQTEIWNQAEIPNWKKGGRPPDRRRYVFET